MELAVYSRFNFVKDCYVVNAEVQISFTEFRGQQNINRLKLRRTGRS